MRAFLAELKRQRWDDHRYYHHSRINQTLHLVSALSFLTAYAFVFTSPVLAALLGWLVSMVTRQLGHFFFEPKDYDVVNQATHAHKEDIKVGYNLKRKVVLMSLWGLSPLVLWFDPTLQGIYRPDPDHAQFLRHLAQVWLALGVGALLFRTAQLCLQQSVLTGFAWATKILTDPFHDVKLYCRAPLYLLRGELIDPMDDVVHHA
jgi:di/tricarboxylate transporter